MTRLPNVRLLAAIERSGLSYEALARAVRAVAVESGDDSIRTSKSNIAYWVRGTPPSPNTARYLLEALSRRLRSPLCPEDLGLPNTARWDSLDLGLTVDDDPIETLARIGRADIERRQFLTTAAYSAAGAALPLGVGDEIRHRTERALTGGLAGAAEVDAVKDMVSAFTAVDERHGGQHGRSTVVQYLTDDVRRLCRSRFQTPALQQGMYSAAGSLAYLAGWKAHDVGEVGLAQRYYLQAYSLARHSGSLLDQAFVLRILAHHGMDNDQPAHTLGLADTALRVVRRIPAPPATEALFVICRARALAATGCFTEARKEADRARDLVASGEVGDMIGWVLLWGAPAATVDSHTAKIHEVIGDHQAAEAHYARARRRYNPTGQQRIAALSAASEGRAQLRQGQIERACATWETALTAMSGIRSSRTRKAVRSMRTDLAQFGARGVRSALDLDEQARAWLKQAT